MNQITNELIRAALRSDPTIPQERRPAVMRAVRTALAPVPKTKAQDTGGPRLVRRREAAERLGVSLRAVDSWAEEGLLRKVRLPGRQRSAGFLEDDLAAFIQGVRGD